MSKARTVKPSETPRRGPVAYLRALGPGIISGASDNDPTTVGTMAVLGATTVYGLSWLTILIYPMLAVIQMISAQVGVVAKQGLQRVVRERYGRRWGFLLLASLLVVNLITIGADLEGGAAALGLLFHVSWQWFVIPFAAVMLTIITLGSYRALENVLQYVLLVFVAYMAAAFLARPDWVAVFQATIHPALKFNSTYVQGALALLGTTLTSYAYVWQTIEEAEEKPKVSELGLQRADAGVGMIFAVAIFWFILISTGATLGIHHKHVATAQQAAQALVPVAGPLAGDIFALGLLASAILAVPVLAATSGYVLGHEFGWKVGLSRKIGECPAFYGAVAGATAIAVIISFVGVSPIQLLFVAGMAGGLGTPVSLAFLLLASRDKQVMGNHRMNPVLLAMGWVTLVVVTLVSLFFLAQQFGFVHV
ncbi:MAG: NRAMP family divalent metal transporter [Chloroflexota bacterium]